MAPHTARVLIICFTDARRDPRVYRQIQALRSEYALTVIGEGDPGVEDVRFISVETVPARSSLQRVGRALTLLRGDYASFLLDRFRPADQGQLEAVAFDAVIVNDLEPLPMGFALAKGAPVIFDAHEYYPELTSQFFWRFFFRRASINACRTFIPRCAGMMTVAPDIAREYERHFGVLPTLVYNAPPSQALTPGPVESGKIRLLHHGSANTDRQIGVMIDMMRHVDKRFTLDLMLVGDQREIAMLRERSKGMDTVIWREPVPMQELAGVANAYDLGVHIIAPTSFNNLHALPNKFFEFIQARVAVAIGPSVEMAAITREYDIGLVADDFTPRAMAAKLNSLTAEDVMRFKRNTERAAKVYNAEAGSRCIRDMVRMALNKDAL